MRDYEDYLDEIYDNYIEWQEDITEKAKKRGYFTEPEKLELKMIFDYLYHNFDRRYNNKIWRVDNGITIQFTTRI